MDTAKNRGACSASPIRVAVADDHEVVRAGVCRLLERCGGFAVVCEAASFDGLVAALDRQSRVDVALLDVHMPGMEGPQAITALRCHRVHPRVVVYTMYPEDTYAVRYLRAGAGAFIHKGQPATVLRDAVIKVATGGRYITPQLAEHLFANDIDLEQDPCAALSAREMEVARRLCAGHSSGDVARELGVSPSTIYTYVQRIKTKLGARTLVDIYRILATDL